MKENYPGFVDGIQGPELMDILEKQARRFGTDVLEADVLKVSGDGSPFTVETKKGNIQASSVVVATGAYAKRLKVPGSEEFWNKGISACAVCDGALPIFRDKELLVVGGGDSACEEALFLTKYGSKVYVALRRDAFRASKIMVDRVLANDKIEVLYNHQLKEVHGDQLVGKVTLESTDGNTKEINVSGVFFAIGHTPNSDFLDEKVKKDDNGYILVEGFTSATSVPGIYAAGDVCDKRYRQAITSAGMGCMAALDAEKFLTTIHESVNH